MGETIADIMNSTAQAVNYLTDALRRRRSAGWSRSFQVESAALQINTSKTGKRQENQHF